MSRIFGPVCQAAYVTDDLERTLAFLHRTAGLGPWFVAWDIPVPECSYRGAPVDLHIHAALTSSGGMQIEVIQQISPAPSIYTEFSDRHGPGLMPHHFASWSDRYDEVLRDAAENGFEKVQEGRSRHGDFVYFGHPDEPDFVFEVTALTPGRQSIFDQIRRAAAGWDGSDPIRDGWPTPKF